MRGLLEKKSTVNYKYIVRYLKGLHTHLKGVYVNTFYITNIYPKHHEHLPLPFSFRGDISTRHNGTTQSSNWSTCRAGSEFTHSSRNCTSSVALWASVPTIALLYVNSSGALQSSPSLMNSTGKLQLQWYEIASAIPTVHIGPNHLKLLSL